MDVAGGIDRGEAPSLAPSPLPTLLPKFSSLLLHSFDGEDRIGFDFVPAEKLAPAVSGTAVAAKRTTPLSSSGWIISPAVDSPIKSVCAFSWNSRRYTSDPCETYRPERSLRDIEEGNRGHRKGRWRINAHRRTKVWANRWCD